MRVSVQPWRPAWKALKKKPGRSWPRCASISDHSVRGQRPVLRDLLTDQPIRCHQQIDGHGSESANLDLLLALRPSRDAPRHNRFLLDVETCTMPVDHIHLVSPLRYGLWLVRCLGLMILTHVHSGPGRIPQLAVPRGIQVRLSIRLTALSTLRPSHQPCGASIPHFH